MVDLGSKLWLQEPLDVVVIFSSPGHDHVRLLIPTDYGEAVNFNYHVNYHVSYRDVPLSERPRRYFGLLVPRRGKVIRRIWRESRDATKRVLPLLELRFECLLPADQSLDWARANGRLLHMMTPTLGTGEVSC